MVVALSLVLIVLVDLNVLVFLDILLIQIFRFALVFLHFKISITLIYCLDNNECTFNNGGCDQICHNTNGSYFCSCNFSYVISSDNHRCNGMFTLYYSFDDSLFTNN